MASGVSEEFVTIEEDIPGILTDITEYGEGHPVRLMQLDPGDLERCSGLIPKEFHQAYIEKRHVIVAKNEGGYNSTSVDLVQLLMFIKENLPEVWDKVNKTKG